MNDRAPTSPLTAAGLLALLAAAGTALLAGTWWLTHEHIAAEERRVVLRQLQQLVPASEYDNALQDDRITIVDAEAFATETPVVVWRARRGDEPVAAVMRVSAPGGYNGPIELLIGIDADGRLRGVRVTRHRETPGLGDAIEAERSDWIRQFRGRAIGNPPLDQWRVRADGGSFDQLTGATITPRAVVAGVRRALVYFENHRDTLFNRPSEATDDDG